MTGTTYRCLRCHKPRHSSNPRADKDGTTCPLCLLAERDQQRREAP